MRPVHATHSVAKTGLAQPVATGLPSNGTSTSDAFASLVQALADLQGQGDDSSTDSNDGGTGQNTQTGTSATPVVPPGQKNVVKTAPAGDPAVVVATVESETPAPTAATEDKDPTAPTDAQASSTAVDATAIPDQAALALLAAALPNAPVVRTTTPAPTAISGPSGKLTDTTTTADAAVASTTVGADTAVASNTAAATTAADPTPNSTLTPIPEAAVASASAQTADTTDTPSASPDATNAANAARIAAAMPSGLAGLQRLSIRPAGVAAAPKADGANKSAVASIPTASRTTKAATSLATNAPPPATTHAHGLGRASSDGLPPTQSNDGTQSTQGTNATAPARNDDTSGVSAATAPAPDTSGAQPVPAAAPRGVTVDMAAPTAAAAGAQAVSTTPSATNVAAPDPQNLVLMSRSAALAASAVAQVNVVLQRAGLSRADSLTVQLDPAELGRVEVKLKMDKSGGPVHATVTADRPQTLDMLKNDKGALERALQSAGLSTDSGSLSFNLRGNGGSGQQAAANGSGGALANETDDGAAALQLAAVAAPNGWTESGHLDLRV